MFKGSLLAMDVGGGTQDIFIWEPGQTVENGVKLVLPAPTQVLARRLRRLTAQGQPIFLTGRVMGGGAVTQAVRRHLGQGLPVYATPQAAFTFSDRLEAVQGWGVILTESPPPGVVTLTLGDVGLEGLAPGAGGLRGPFPQPFCRGGSGPRVSPPGQQPPFPLPGLGKFSGAGRQTGRPGQPPATRPLHPDGGRGRGFARGGVDGYLRRRGSGGRSSIPRPGPIWTTASRWSTWAMPTPLPPWSGATASGGFTNITPGC